MLNALDALTTAFAVWHAGVDVESNALVRAIILFGGVRFFVGVKLVIGIGIALVVQNRTSVKTLWILVGACALYLGVVLNNAREVIELAIAWTVRGVW